MQPLVDGDVLVYECGFGAQTGWEKEDPPPFDMAKDLLDNRIANICATVGATHSPIIYLTGEGNFREKIAITKPYKGNRKGAKPFHYENLRAYMVGVLGATVIDGMEADDAMSLKQCEINSDPLLLPEELSIICSRDKDLRQVPGYHYSWELGNQPSFGPDFCFHYGWLKLSADKKKLIGMGDKFFLAQCIMGDPVDNIQGIPKAGPSKAFELLQNTQTYEEGLSCVVATYKGFYGDDWEARLLENGQLLWMVRELDEEGKPVMWSLYD